MAGEIKESNDTNLDSYLGKWGLGRYIPSDTICLNDTCTIFQLYNPEDGSYVYVEIDQDNILIIDQETYENECWLDEDPIF